MRDAPKISIVMPSLNQALFLRQAMESVLDQRYANLEFIVVDGGSSDDSPAIIRSMERHLAWWTSEGDAGQAAAINRGFSRATGDVFGWLNSDDYYLDGALHKVADAHRRNPTAGLLVGNGLRVDEHGKRIDVFSRAPMAVDQHTLAHGVDYLLQPSTFFLRSAWHRVGGLREDLRWCMDWDLWIRISGAHSAEAIDAILAVSREHSATKTATGGFERWTEIRRLTESHTGMQLTPGALAYFLHTLHDFLQSDPQAIHYMSGLRPVTDRYWAKVSQLCLKPLTGRIDGFPSGPPQLHPLGPDIETMRDDLLDRQRVAARTRQQRTREILDSLGNELTQKGHTDLRELAGHLDNLQRQVAEQETDLIELKLGLRKMSEQLDHHTERLQRMERRLLVRAGKALRLI
jgi:hypothetical protein